MGGIFGGKRSRPAPAPEPKPEPAQPAAKPAEIEMAEDKAARRRARRGGRGLLSESRLNPEQGVTTLGQSGML
jgi:hypothetical protein